MCQLLKLWEKGVPNSSRMPALLKRTSIVPKFLTISFIHWSTHSSSETSKPKINTLLVNRSLRLLLAFSKFFKSLSIKANLAPSSAKRKAEERPIPLAAPVITTTLSLNLIASHILL